MKLDLDLHDWAAIRNLVAAYACEPVGKRFEDELNRVWLSDIEEAKSRFEATKAFLEQKDNK